MLPKRITAWPLPDRPDTVAFMDGPLVLAGLLDEARTLHGDPRHPEELLAPDNEHANGPSGAPATIPVARTATSTCSRSIGVTDEVYTVYFPVRAPVV